MQRICSLLLVLLLVSCTSPALDESNDGDTVALQVGDVFDLSLASNLTTGFDWHIVQMDETVVRQLGETTHEQTGDEGVVGAGGLTFFEFEAVGEGTTTVVLHYARSWEDEAPEETYELTVTVGA